MSSTDEIKARLDIVNYIQQAVPLKKSGRTWKACCPFHNERTPSFVVDPERQTWRCYGACNEGGDIFSFAMKYHGWGFAEALEELGRQAGVEVKPRTPAQQAEDAHLDHLRGLMSTTADFYAEQLAVNVDALNYVRSKRGLSDETIARFGIGYAPDGWQTTLNYLTGLGYDEDQLVAVGLARRSDSGRVYDYFRHRLVIPIRDSRGQVVGFGARVLNPEDTPKYLNSPQTALFDKSRILFGLDLSRQSIREWGLVVIVEGYMDAIQAHQAGFTNVVAQMGTALTETQLKLVAPQLAQRVVLALDADAAGQNATMRSLEMAREAMKADFTGRLQVEMRVLQIPGAKDPDDLLRETPDLWAELVREATPVADYVIETEMQALPDDAGVVEVEAMVRRLLPILRASESDNINRTNIMKLESRLHQLRIERDVAFDVGYLLALDAQQGRKQVVRPPRMTGSEAEPPPLADIPRPTPQPPPDDVLEMGCLHGLFSNPDLYFQVNRKLRELAGYDAALLDGPLADLSAADFTRSEYRVLMTFLLEAISQSDMTATAYIDQHLEDVLRPTYDRLMQAELDALRPRLRHGLSVDLPVIMREKERFSREHEIEARVIESALRLRLRRLQREREDLFLAMNGDANAFGHRIGLSIRAKNLIDTALQELARSLY